MKLMIISGRSGSGKSVALHALEDQGFYCIDNLPLTLLPNLDQAIGNLHPRVAVSIDARNLPQDLSHFQELIMNLKAECEDFDIVYLDADENILLKRFSETRRKHPLTSAQISLREAIRIEDQLLEPIADMADFTIDTGQLSQHDLHQFIRDRTDKMKADHLQLLVQSFGYKFGIPLDADFVFDVRCLPNPYWETELRAHSGLDAQVQDFFKQHPSVADMIEDIRAFLTNWIPNFKADNRSYMSIAIGCTGGQHRSVYIVQQLARLLNEWVDNIQVRHREIDLAKSA